MSLSSTISFAVFVGLASIVLLSGCTPATYNIRQYVLEATRPGQPAETQSQAVLAVNRFAIDAAFADNSFVYRLEEFAYESDFYHRFLIAPAVMVTEQTRLWLARSGLFECVAIPGGRLEPAHSPVWRLQG
jgi:hypothetical protein